MFSLCRKRSFFAHSFPKKKAKLYWPLFHVLKSGGKQPRSKALHLWLSEPSRVTWKKPAGPSSRFNTRRNRMGAFTEWFEHSTERTCYFTEALSTKSMIGLQVLVQLLSNAYICIFFLPLKWIVFLNHLTASVNDRFYYFMSFHWSLQATTLNSLKEKKRHLIVNILLWRIIYLCVYSVLMCTMNQSFRTFKRLCVVLNHICNRSLSNWCFTLSTILYCLCKIT